MYLLMNFAVVYIVVYGTFLLVCLGVDRWHRRPWWTTANVVRLRLRCRRERLAYVVRRFLRKAASWLHR